jgi:hypothetical protein
VPYGKSTYTFGVQQYDVKNNPAVIPFLQANKFTDNEIADLSKNIPLSTTELSALNQKLANIPSATMDAFTNQQLQDTLDTVNNLIADLYTTNYPIAQAIAGSQALQLALADYDNQFNGIEGIGQTTAPINSMLAYLRGQQVTESGGSSQLNGDTLTLSDVQNYINNSSQGMKHPSITQNRAANLQTALSSMTFNDASAAPNTIDAQINDTSAVNALASGGYNYNNGYNIYGFNANGQLDPSIAANGGQTNTVAFNDGSSVSVGIKPDGTSTATWLYGNGSISVQQRDASGNVTNEIDTQPLVGTSDTSALYSCPRTDYLSALFSSSSSSSSASGTTLGSATIDDPSSGVVVNDATSAANQLATDVYPYPTATVADASNGDLGLLPDDTNADARTALTNTLAQQLGDMSGTFQIADNGNGSYMVTGSNGAIITVNSDLSGNTVMPDSNDGYTETAFDTTGAVQSTVTSAQNGNGGQDLTFSNADGQVTEQAQIGVDAQTQSFLDPATGNLISQSSSNADSPATVSAFNADGQTTEQDQVDINAGSQTQTQSFYDPTSGDLTGQSITTATADSPDTVTTLNGSGQMTQQDQYAADGTDTQTIYDPDTGAQISQSVMTVNVQADGNSYAVWSYPGCGDVGDARATASTLIQQDCTNSQEIPHEIQQSSYRYAAKWCYNTRYSHVV